MGKYRKKPVEIEAFRYHAEKTYSDWPAWAKEELKHNVDGLVVARDDPASRAIEAFPDHLLIHTLEGDHRANDGDWIIQGVEGEIYPCKPSVFAATYDIV